jgi:hypothetical protein
MWAPNHSEYQGVAGVHSPKTFSLSEVKVPVSQQKELLREQTQNTEWESNVISLDC